MYDPKIGRFLSEDPIGFDGDPTNLYRYVRNSPLDSTDPDGLWTRTQKLTLKGDPAPDDGPPQIRLSISYEKGVTTWVAGAWNAGQCDYHIRQGGQPDWKAAEAAIDELIKKGVKINEVIISSHGVIGGGWGGTLGSEITNPKNDSYQFLLKLKQVLAPYSRIEIRTCNGASFDGGKQLMKDLAKLLNAEVIAWDGTYAIWPWGDELIADPSGGKLKVIRTPGVTPTSPK